MRNLTILALTTLSSLAVAQSPLVTTGGVANNGGNVGGGLYFDLTVNTTITIERLSYYTGTATPAGASSSVNIWLGPSTYLNNVTNPSLWTMVGSTAPTTVAGGGTYSLVSGAIVTPVAAAPSVTLEPGTYGISLQSVGASHGYTNPVGCTSNTIPGSCTNSLFSNAELTLAAGAAQNAFLAGGVFTPRIFTGEIEYSLGGTPLTFAARESYGDGCYTNYQSWGQLFPNPIGAGYANTSLLMSYQGNGAGYLCTAGTTAPVAPISPSLGHGDDDDILIDLSATQPWLYATSGGATGVTTMVNMNANGYITLDGVTTHTAGPAATQAGVDAWLAGGATVGNWKDFNPSAGGTTHYDYDGVNFINLFTWQAVEDFGGVTTFQIAEFANGDIEFRWGAVAQTGGGNAPILVGFTPGAGAVDPGVLTFDFMGSTPFSTQGTDSNPLTLSAATNPVVGTTVDLLTTNESTNPGLGICFITEAAIIPGFNLGILGAPDCFANVDINVGAGFVIDNIPVNGMTISFPIPNNPANVGLSFYCQSAWLDAAANGFGIITSNGLRLLIGSF